MRRLFLVAIVVALLRLDVGGSRRAAAGGASRVGEGDRRPGEAQPAAVDHARRRGNGGRAGRGRDGGREGLHERPGVGHLPAFLDGVPVAVQVTGKLTALKSCRAKQNAAPWSPSAVRPTAITTTADELVTFAATALDKQEGDLSSGLVWTSSIDGPLGTGTGFTHVLSVGTHTITASATDSRLLTGAGLGHRHRRRDARPADDHRRLASSRSRSACPPATPRTCPPAPSPAVSWTRPATSTPEQHPRVRAERHRRPGRDRGRRHAAGSLRRRRPTCTTRACVWGRSRPTSRSTAASSRSTTSTPRSR